MSWLTAILTAVLGFFTGKQKTKADTLALVNKILRRGQDAKKNTEIDLSHRRD